MGTTKSLNSSDTVYCTTFYGGRVPGRSYEFTVIKDEVKVKVILTEDELFSMLAGRDDAKVALDDKQRPEMLGR